MNLFKAIKEWLNPSRVSIKVPPAPPEPPDLFAEDRFLRVGMSYNACFREMETHVIALTHRIEELEAELARLDVAHLEWANRELHPAFNAPIQDDPPPNPKQGDLWTPTGRQTHVFINGEWVEIASFSGFHLRPDGGVEGDGTLGMPWDPEDVIEEYHLNRPGVTDDRAYQPQGYYN